MSKTHVFVDFDKTLFDPRSYERWLDKQPKIMGLSSKTHGSFSQTIDDYHDVFSEIPLMRKYHHAEHIRAVCNKPWELMSGEIEKLIHGQHKDFCYPSAHELLRWLSKEDYDVRLNFDVWRWGIPALQTNDLPVFK